MNHKIVVLDGYTLNPGDLSWSELERLVPDMEIYDRTSEELIIERSLGASIILTNKTPLKANTLRNLPDLRFVSVLATGYNIIDIVEARRRGVVVSNVPAYGTRSVMQLVFAFILHWTNGVAHHALRVREGAWTSCLDFSFWDFPLRELQGKTLGIIGLGRIGREVARVGHAFGMKIAAAVRSPKLMEFSVNYLDIDEIFAMADFLCIHCPLTPETQGLVNKSRLQLMKPSAYLINTSRGAIVNEEDLASALNEGLIAGAGVDVLSVEPPPASNPLLQARNIIVTPHYAWASVEA